MGETIFKIFGVTMVMMMLSGCVIIINNGKPTEDEKTLMNIETRASQEVAKINEKIQSGNYSVPQIQELVTEAKKVMDENLQKINGLKLPERTKTMAEKTKEYLQQARQTYGDFLEMTSQTASQTVTQTNQQIQTLISNLQTMSQPLFTMAGQIDEMKNQFLDELQKATSASPQTQQK